MRLGKLVGTTTSRRVKGGILVLFMCALLLFGLVDTAMAVNEWSDITYIEGRYSRIYFDYVPPTVYVINDWVVNQDDGGIAGGLKPGEYNRFSFFVGADYYEIRIYADGTGAIFRSGSPLDPASLNFKGAYSWNTSPNEPSKKHTIWEWSIDLPPTVILQYFEACDAPGGWVPTYLPPPVPSITTTGPSMYGHFIDGEFKDVMAASTLAPNPSRSSQDPIKDPWFTGGDLDLQLLGGGGVRVTYMKHVPVSNIAGLFALGIVALAILATRMRGMVKSSEV